MTEAESAYVRQLGVSIERQRQLLDEANRVIALLVEKQGGVTFLANREIYGRDRALVAHHVDQPEKGLRLEIESEAP